MSGKDRADVRHTTTLDEPIRMAGCVRRPVDRDVRRLFKARGSQTAGCLRVTGEPVASRCRRSRATSVTRFRKRQSRALWEFLPPSYRRDVQRLARDVAARLDEKSWGPFVATGQKARQVLPKKLSSLTPPKSDDNERGPGASVPFDPAALAQLLDAIGDSELGDLQRLRSIELDRFLDQTGDKLLATLGRIAVGDHNGSADDPFSQFGKVQVELISSSVASGVVQIRWPEQEPTTQEFVRVEDQWIPQSLAEAWPAQFAEVRERSLAWANRVREHPDESHARLREIDQWLDELAATKSADNARQVWQAGVSRLAMAWIGVASPADSTPRGEAAPAWPKASAGWRPK